MLGLLGVALNQFFFVLGLSRTSVGHAAILGGLTPLMVLAVAGAMRMERVAPRKVAGMLVALAGVVAITALPSKAGHDSPVGNLFIFLGSLTFALFTVAGKRSTGRYGGITVNTFAYVGGGLALAPLTLWQGWNFQFSSVGASGWASLLFMAAFPAVLCYLIYYWALNHIAASRISVLSYLQPPIATLMAVPLLGEVVTLPLIAGGALVFAGVYITERSR
jgi:drug/metabolite transporter (DMT)-like permease